MLARRFRCAARSVETRTLKRAASRLKMMEDKAHLRGFSRLPYIHIRLAVRISGR